MKAGAKGGKKGAWRAILKCVALGVWTWLVLIGVQLVVGSVMVLILGAKQVTKPLWTSVYSALSYTLAMLILLFLTPKLLDLGAFCRRKWAARKASQKNAEGGLKARGELRLTGVKHKLPTREELGLKGMPTWTDIGLAPIGYIVANLLTVGISLVFQLFPWYNAEEAQDVGYSTFLVGTDRIMAFLILVVVAPIVEEVIFRGWLYGKLREMLGEKAGKWGSIAIAILIVSLLFGILHGQWNVGVTVFAMSVVVCALREITGTIYAGILVHMIRNGLGFYLLYVVGMV